MIKKFLLGFVIGLIVSLPVGAFAYTIVTYPYTKPLYEINDDADISKFTDGNNVCYVTAYRSTDQPTISCVKK